MAKPKLKIKYLCDDDQSRKKGMMGRDMDDDQCAFFIFPNKACHSFWNKNVNFDLRLFFVNDKFEIVDVQDMKAGSENPVYPDSREIKYVIEVKKGFCENNDVNKGDYVDFDPDSGSLAILRAK